MRSWSSAAAIIGGGVFEDFEVIDQFLTIESIQQPHSEHQNIYRKMKPIFDHCYSALVEVYEELAGLFSDT